MSFVVLNNYIKVVELRFVTYFYTVFICVVDKPTKNVVSGTTKNKIEKTKPTPVINIHEEGTDRNDEQTFLTVISSFFGVVFLIILSCIIYKRLKRLAVSIFYT